MAESRPAAPQFALYHGFFIRPPTDPVVVVCRLPGADRSCALFPARLCSSLFALLAHRYGLSSELCRRLLCGLYEETGFLSLAVVRSKGSGVIAQSPGRKERTHTTL